MLKTCLRLSRADALFWRVNSSSTKDCFRWLSEAGHIVTYNMILKKKLKYLKTSIKEFHININRIRGLTKTYKTNNIILLRIPIDQTKYSRLRCIVLRLYLLTEFFLGVHEFYNSFSKDSGK